MTTFKTTICLARQLTRNTDHIDEEEDIASIRKFPIASIKKMIFDGEIANTESIAALLLAFAYLDTQ